MVDRTIINPLEQMRDFDFVQGAKDVMVGVGNLAQDILSGASISTVAGFTVTATAPATLTINLGPGRIYTLAAADATTNGSITEDLTTIVQQGANPGQAITLAPPSAGQSQWNLIQCQFSQVDSVRANDPNAGTVPFYNSSNPTIPNTESIDTVRQGLCVLQVITGSAATTGSETPPQPTSGWTPLYLIDIAGGQSQITAAQVKIAQPSIGTGVPTNYPFAPFIAGLLASHHSGNPGQAPKINLATEVQGILPYNFMSPVRQRISGPLTLFVNSSTGNDANTGLSPSIPFKTIQAAVTSLETNYDLAGFNCIIQLANGTYPPPAGSAANFICGGDFVGSINQSQVTILGNVASPGSVIIQAPNVAGGVGVSLPQGGSLILSGATFVALGNLVAALISVGQNGLAQFGPSCVFGSAGTGGEHITVGNGGGCFLTSSYSITGSAVAHLGCNNGGWMLYSPGVVVTLTGTPAFSVAFAVTSDSGRILAPHTSVTFTGSATGVRYNVGTFSFIDTAGGGATFLPGNSAGLGSGTNGALYV